jgi:hypothetical protein
VTKHRRTVQISDASPARVALSRRKDVMDNAVCFFFLALALEDPLKVVSLEIDE